MGAMSVKIAFLTLSLQVLSVALAIAVIAAVVLYVKSQPTAS
jgi:hypothetical protein